MVELGEMMANQDLVWAFAFLGKPNPNNELYACFMLNCKACISVCQEAERTRACPSGKERTFLYRIVLPQETEGDARQEEDLGD